MPASASREVPEAPCAVSADVVERLRAGDEAAFRDVYEAYRARLYSFLLRLTHDEALALDLTQETWLRLAANVSRLTPDTEPGAWLFRVARNLFISQRRWALVQAAGLAALGLAPSPILPSALEQVAADALERKLEHALAQLPLRYREVLLLTAVEGFPAPQVADILGLTPATVRQRLARGRAALKDALDP
ncbi:MAG TPA: RNA polymerase sigma factor [Polyangiales bacterium]|nr:RNA polymerase sigma factor [Polyangiales bacterium]